VSVRRLNHFSLTVADIDASLAFWRDVLGLALLGRGVAEYDHLDRIIGVGHTRIEWAELAIPGGTILELFRYLEPEGHPIRPAPSDPGSTHICLEVDGLDLLIRQIHESGYTTRSPQPVEIPFGDWQGFRDIYVTDPDGAIVELTEAPPTPPAKGRASEHVRLVPP
jgi:catechol 2,3-dioxygenase-like lactoylglutathione lyase family enzyme